MNLSKTPLFKTLALTGLLATGLAGASTASAQSSDDVLRTIVQVADVVFRDGQPYYGNERLVVGRDQYGRTVYYRVQDSRYGYDYDRDRDGVADRYDAYDNRNMRRTTRTTCNYNGWCTTTTSFYDRTYDRSRGGRIYRY